MLNPRIAVIAIVTIASTIGISPAGAEDSEPDYGRPGFYMGVGVEGGVYTELDDELEDELAALGYVLNVDTDTAVGFDLFAGYRVHPFFSAELEFEMMPKANIDVSGFGEIAELRTRAFTANVKAFPLAGRVQPFFLLGIGVLHATIEDSVGAGLEESEADLAFRFGGGLDVYMTQQLVVWARSTYVLPTGDLDFLDYVSFGGGLQIRF